MFGQMIASYCKDQSWPLPLEEGVMFLAAQASGWRMAKRSGPYRQDRPTTAELAAGGVVMHPDGRRVLLIHEKVEGRWTLPKGHVEKGETLMHAALREVAEETGIRGLKVLTEIGDVTYRFYDPAKKHNVQKVVVYFLMGTGETEVALENLFDKHQWFSLDIAVTTVEYSGERSILASVRAVPPR